MKFLYKETINIFYIWVYNILLNIVTPFIPEESSKKSAAIRYKRKISGHEKCNKTLITL